MKKITVIIIFLSFAFQFSVQAQNQLKDKIYADAKVGIGGGINSQLQIGLGYLLHKNHGIGLSYHRETGGSVYAFKGMHGLGIDYRYTTDFGLITKIGVGKVLNGWQAEDTSDEYVYKSSKLFTDFSVEYQLGIGITFGIYATFSPEMTFDRYLPGIHSEPFIDSEELIFQNESKSQFVNFGLSIGYAVPWKNKRKKRNKI